MYIRMLALIVVNLYSVPIVLHALGVEDYGIYNVVGGFVMMFTFINGSLVSGCQRFMAFAIGKRDEKYLKSVFDTSLFIFVSLAFVLFVVLELFGIWFLNNNMNIPHERIIAANWVMHMSILSLIITIISTPFNSLVIAHEKMSIYAFASIFDSINKLLIAFFISVVSSDKLIVYAILLMASSFFLTSFYFLYCKFHFRETKKLRIRQDVELLRNISSYAGWNIIGALANVLRNHGLNIILNLFFSPVMNASHTIASHLSGLFSQFVNNVYMATRPQMVKQYASGNIEEMWIITYRSSKYAFFLMIYITVPVVIELPLFLSLWLHEVPAFTIIFSRLIILSLVIETMVNQLIGVFQASNKIRCYQSVSSIILLLLIPISFIALKLYLNPVIPYLLCVIVSITYAISIVIIAYRQIGLNIISYIREVICKDVLVLAPSFMFTYFVVHFISYGIFRLLITLFISLSLTTIFIWCWGINNNERKAIIKFLKRNQNYI